MTFKSKSMKFMAVLIICVALIVIGGCQRQACQAEKIIAETLTLTTGADPQRSTEVQLVEQMARYRGQYENHLSLIKDFYDRQGNHLKASWAVDELAHLEAGPKHSYLVIAETAGADLRARETIIDADLLYRAGMNLYKQGRGKLGKFFVNEKKLYLATDKFNELIESYPESDKIDDAAFQIAEIYNHYLKDYRKALLYYQRVWQWDTLTPLPARFAVAQIYDEYLHDRVKALEYYQLAITLEPNFPDKAEYAQSRIDEITKEMTEE